MRDLIVSGSAAYQNFTCVKASNASASTTFASLTFDDGIDFSTMYLQANVHKYSFNSTLMTTDWALIQGKNS